MRVVLRGYRVEEVPLKKLDPIKDGTKISRPRSWDPGVRPIVAVSAGCHVRGVVLPHPDPQCPRTMVLGVHRRFAFRPPDPEEEVLKRFEAFVRKWVHANLTPLDPDEDVSVEAWLLKTSYPQWRKKQLLDCYYRMLSINQKDKRGRKIFFKNKSFMKDEFYPEYKHARAINSRSDEFKCATGPFFKCIEKALFSLDHFIKKIPIADRPAYIKSRLERLGAKYFAADYTSYESLFTKKLMQRCEFILYEYMVSKHPLGAEFLKLISEALLEQNVCQFKLFTVLVWATRMSGEMNTSLANGFSNLMFLLFLCEENGMTDVSAVIEGDDSAASGCGTWPTVSDFAKLGLVIKVEMSDTIEEMSFCGLVFDSKELCNVTDPKEVLAGFGWTSATYASSSERKLKMLLRCKALSYAHQYPGCPVISALAQYGLRVTRSMDIRGFVATNHHMSSWERDQVLAALRDEKNIPIHAPGPGTRALVAKLYNLPVETQIAIEKYLDEKNDLSPIDCHHIDMAMPQMWKDNFETYTSVSDVMASDKNYPPETWSRQDRFSLVKRWDGDVPVMR